MKLLHRITTLIRADVAELLARADDPAAVLVRFKSDVHNHVLQLRTAIAQNMADLAAMERSPAESCHDPAAAAERGIDRASRLRVKMEDAESLRALLGPLEAKSREADAVYAESARGQARRQPTEALVADSDGGGGTAEQASAGGRLDRVLDAIHGYMDRVEAASVAPPAPEASARTATR